MEDGPASAERVDEEAETSSTYIEVVDGTLAGKVPERDVPVVGKESGISIASLLSRSRGEISGTRNPAVAASELLVLVVLGR